MIYAETSFDKAVDDALDEMSRKDKTMAFKCDDNGYQPKKLGVEATPPKGGSAMQEEIVKPMNPYAAEDFANAIKEATNKLGKELGKIGGQMRKESPLLGYDDMYPEYGGRMSLNYLNGIGG